MHLTCYLNFQMTMRMISDCYLDETILSVIQRRRTFVELGVHTIGLHTVGRPLLAWLKNSHIGVQ